MNLNISIFIMGKYNAIIVEPRKHKAIEFVLNNVCKCLDNDWDILFFHGNDNELYVSEIVFSLNKIYGNRITMINLHIKNMNLMEYSKLFATKDILYEHIKSEIFLVFQTDSLILEKNKDLIYDFVEYDYVGGPWLVTQYIPTKNCDFIGNGGFSLRRKFKMLEIIEKIVWNDLYEDLYFSTKYNGIEIKKPHYEKAVQFSIEEVFSEMSFGCHKPWKQGFYEQFKQLYPEIEILKNLQYVE